MKKQAVLFLEPINHIFGVLHTAHQKGYAAISLNCLGIKASAPYAEAQDCISAEYRISSWTDKTAVMAAFEQICADFDVVGTYTGSEITLEYNAIFRQQLGLPTSTPETVVRNLNKLKVRRLLNDHGLSALQTVSMKEMATLQEWPFERSGFFKPNSGAGSANVWHCKTMDDLRNSIVKWHDRNRIQYQVLLDHIESTGEYFLEEAAPGKLFSVESIVVDGKVTVIGMTGRAVSARDSAIEMGCFFPFSSPFEKSIIEKVTRIHEVMEIKHGPTHAELIIDDKGNLELVEMNIRFAGYDMLSVVSYALQKDFSETLLALALGQLPDCNSFKPVVASGIAMVMPPSDLKIFESLDFPQDVVFTRLMKPLGEEIKSHDSQLDYVGSGVLLADNSEQLIEKLCAIRSNTTVNGKSIEHCQNNEIVI